MVTMFTTAKPFRGHSGVIQRNALQSWKRLHPEVEVIVFGDEDGVAEVCRELGLCHKPSVETNAQGVPYVSFLFDRAQELARHDVLCYANCDIVLLADFPIAVERAYKSNTSFLMVGRRWDTPVTEAIDFSASDWEERLRCFVFDVGERRSPQAVDYFVFSRGLYNHKIPPFAIGRMAWDSWLVWYARHCRAKVIDASEVVMAVHQNHDYSHHPNGTSGVYSGVDAQQNFWLAGFWHMADIRNSTHRLTPEGLQSVPRDWKLWRRQNFYEAPMRAWYWLLAWTRPLRYRLGVRRAPKQRVVTR